MKEPNPQEVFEEEEEQLPPGILERTSYKPPEDRAAWAFDNEMTFYELKAELLGAKVTRDKNGYLMLAKNKNDIPLMDREGTEITMALVRGFLNNINAISVYDEARILELCKHTAFKINFLYFKALKNGRYGFNPRTASTIKRMIMTALESCLRKSLEGASFKVLMNTERTVISRQEIPGGKKLLGFIPMP